MSGSSVALQLNDRRIHHRITKKDETMKRLLLLASLLFANTAFANTQIASCQKPEGYSFFPFIAPVSKSDSGWTKDKTTAGKTTLVKSGEEYDILFTDSTPRGIMSSKADGGRVVLLRKSSKDIAVLVAYQNVTFIYTFWQTADGKFEYSEISSKGGMVSKSSVMVGKCDYVNLR
jgi:hypothetical protein